MTKKEIIDTINKYENLLKEVQNVIIESKILPSYYNTVTSVMIDDENNEELYLYVEDCEGCKESVTIPMSALADKETWLKKVHKKQEEKERRRKQAEEREEFEEYERLKKKFENIKMECEEK